MPDQLPADAEITVEDLPFYVEPGDAIETTETAEAEFAFEFGQAFEDALVELYHLALHQAQEYQDDKAALRAMQMGIKYNPRHILRAAKLFPEVFADGGGANSTDLFAAFTICAKCKDDTDALAAHEWYMMHGPMLDGLKVYLKEHYGAERGKAPTLAEQCAALVRRWTDLNIPFAPIDPIDQCAKELAALREVAKVLERKESDGKA